MSSQSMPVDLSLIDSVNENGELRSNPSGDVSFAWFFVFGTNWAETGSTTQVFQRTENAVSWKRCLAVTPKNIRAILRANSLNRSFLTRWEVNFETRKIQLS